MTFDVSATPYSPNLVPQARQDADTAESLRDLERFLSEEFERIETAMLFVPVQAAYGSLILATGPAADQPLVKGVPTAIGGFDAIRPAELNRIIGVVTGSSDSLQTEEAGVFLVQAQVTATIESGTSYVMTFSRNAVLSDIFGAIDAGNQALFITLTLFGLVTLEAGDIVTLVMTATAGPPGPFTFIMESASFNIVRVSELHKGD